MSERAFTKLLVLFTIFIYRCAGHAIYADKEYADIERTPRAINTVDAVGFVTAVLAIARSDLVNTAKKYTEGNANLASGGSIYFKSVLAGDFNSLEINGESTYQTNSNGANVFAELQYREILLNLDVTVYQQEANYTGNAVYQFNNVTYTCNWTYAQKSDSSTGAFATTLRTQGLKYNGFFNKTVTVEVDAIDEDLRQEVEDALFEDEEYIMLMYLVSKTNERIYYSSLNINFINFTT